MCLSPIRIPNNRRNFLPKYDKIYNVVACGKCAECLQKKQEDYCIRAYYEWEKVKKSKGYAVYVTFTFNNDNLPTFTYKDKTIVCFDKTKVRMFIDALGARLKRQYDSYLGYMWCSEYGGITHRPHYHASLFVDKPIPIYELRQHIKELWTYGFVYFGDNLGIINRTSGITYVSKYITKDLDFYDTHHDFIESVRTSDDFKMLKNNCFPFHIQSRDFGTYMLDCVSIDDFIEGSFKFPTKKGYKLKSVPLYIERKLFYTVDKNKSYRLNQLGVFMRLYRQRLKDENYVKKLHEISSSLDTLLSSDALRIIHSITNIPYTAYDIKQIVKNFFNNYTDTQILDYVNNYRYVTSYDSSFPDDTYFSCLHPLEIRLNRYVDYDVNYEFSDEYSTPFGQISSDKKLFSKFREYDYSLIYELEPSIKILDILRQLYGKYKHSRYEKTFINKSKLKYYEQQR